MRGQKEAPSRASVGQSESASVSRPASPARTQLAGVSQRQRLLSGVSQDLILSAPLTPRLGCGAERGGSSAALGPSVRVAVSALAGSCHLRLGTRCRVLLC